MKPSGVFKVKWRVRYLVLQMHPDKLDGQQWTQFRLIMGATPPPHERWSLSPCISRSGGAANSLCVCCAVSLSCVQHFGTPWTGQAPLSMGILQARILEWVACPPPGDPTNLGIEPRSTALWMDSLPSEPPEKPNNTRVGSLSLLLSSSQPGNPTGVSCSTGRSFTSWATREPPCTVLTDIK